MRRSATHRSKLRRKDEPGASLFSFLAVLICTMGVLIVLLVVIARHARAQAAEEALAQTAQDKRHLAESREDVQWRIEQLRASLAATQSQLADARLELGHLEEHSQKLRGQLAELQETWRQLNAQTPSSLLKKSVKSTFPNRSDRATLGRRSDAATSFVPGTSRWENREWHWDATRNNGSRISGLRRPTCRDPKATCFTAS